jgi:tetratricopeptide (TPR) repeat protein
MRTLALVTISIVLLVGSPVTAAPSDSLDVTLQGIVYQPPGMNRVIVKKDLPFASGKFDLYLPAGHRPSRPVPVVIFINGVGDPTNKKVKDWRIYQDWPRLAATRGWAGIVHESPPGQVPAAVAAIFAHVAEHGRALGLDPERVAAWSCSANVSVALPFLMNQRPRGVRAAVFYYGAGAGPIRADLPVLHVLAGKDGQGLIDQEKAMRQRAVEARAPWTFEDEPTLPHAFDALDVGETSRRAVVQTLGFLEAHLAPLPPAPPATRNRQIMAYIYGQEHAKAAPALEELVETEPDNGTAWFVLGQARRSLGRPADAEQAYEKALAIDPGHAAAANWLGVVQLEQNRPAEAIASFEKAIALGQRFPATFVNLACARARAGQTEPALDALDQAFAAGYDDRAWLAQDPDLESLRSHPRFKAMVQSNASRSP